MIRILIDELGDGHHDVFLKVDASPSFAKVADSYYLSGFLHASPHSAGTRTDLMREYLHYLREGISATGWSSTFLAIDLSDEYVGGLALTKGKKGLIEVKYGWTSGIEGHEVCRDTLDEMIAERNVHFDWERSWLISRVGALQGIDWSLKKLGMDQ